VRLAIGSTRARAVRHAIEHRKPHRDADARRGSAHRGDQLVQELHPRWQRSTTVGTGTLASRQELMQQIPVAMLQVDEVEALFLRQMRGPCETRDQLLHLDVGQDGAVVDPPGAAVEQWVAEGDARLWGGRWTGNLRRRSRPRPPTTVRELQP